MAETKPTEPKPRRKVTIPQLMEKKEGRGADAIPRHRQLAPVSLPPEARWQRRAILE
jgi:hypothetical protein